MLRRRENKTEIVSNLTISHSKHEERISRVRPEPLAPTDWARDRGWVLIATRSPVRWRDATSEGVARRPDLAAVLAAREWTRKKNIGLILLFSDLRNFCGIVYGNWLNLAKNDFYCRKMHFKFFFVHLYIWVTQYMQNIWHGLNYCEYFKFELYIKLWQLNNSLPKP